MSETLSLGTILAATPRAEQRRSAPNFASLLNQTAFLQLLVSPLNAIAYCRL